MVCCRLASCEAVGSVQLALWEFDFDSEHNSTAGNGKLLATDDKSVFDDSSYLYGDQDSVKSLGSSLHAETPIDTGHVYTMGVYAHGSASAAGFGEYTGSSATAKLFAKVPFILAEFV